MYMAMQSDEEWLHFARLFQGKTIETCKFQYRTLNKQKVEAWTEDEQALLKDLVLNHHQATYNWNDIAKELFHSSSESFFRTAKQCREHWNNYLDPKVLKTRWNKE